RAQPDRQSGVFAGSEEAGKLRGFIGAGAFPAHLEHTVVRLGPVQRLDHAADDTQCRRIARRVGGAQSDRTVQGTVQVQCEYREPLSDGENDRWTWTKRERWIFRSGIAAMAGGHSAEDRLDA